MINYDNYENEALTLKVWTLIYKSKEHLFVHVVIYQLHLHLSHTVSLHHWLALHASISQSYPMIFL